MRRPVESSLGGPPWGLEPPWRRDRAHWATDTHPGPDACGFPADADGQTAVSSCRAWLGRGRPLLLSPGAPLPAPSHRGSAWLSVSRLRGFHSRGLEHLSLMPRLQGRALEGREVSEQPVGWLRAGKCFLTHKVLCQQGLWELPAACLRFGGGGSCPDEVRPHSRPTGCRARCGVGHVVVDVGPQMSIWESGVSLVGLTLLLPLNRCCSAKRKADPDPFYSRVWQCPLTGTLEEDRTELRGMCFVRSHASSGSFLVDAPHSPTEHLTCSLGGEEARGWDPAYAGVPELPRGDGTLPSPASAAPWLVPSCRDPQGRGHAGPAGRPVTWACPNFLPAPCGNFTSRLLY
ncbi:uncharacterized protein LOC121040157 [Herpailurus yagouaroundi]|uniref:uncharacterized protein LOC121040157 n=1 Tax=Herpailurus yagouaroundi TaxID=1608482 RepID=UPI001AD6EAD8|nr:uncharacterized protein LOC121040157 [Puma yagouaroundi]